MYITELCDDIQSNPRASKAMAEGSDREESSAQAGTSEESVSTEKCLLLISSKANESRFAGLLLLLHILRKECEEDVRKRVAERAFERLDEIFFLQLASSESTLELATHIGAGLAQTSHLICSDMKLWRVITTGLNTISQSSTLDDDKRHGVAGELLALAEKAINLCKVIPDEIPEYPQHIHTFVDMLLDRERAWPDEIVLRLVTVLHMALNRMSSERRSIAIMNISADGDDFKGANKRQTQRNAFVNVTQYLSKLSSSYQIDDEACLKVGTEYS